MNDLNKFNKDRCKKNRKFIKFFSGMVIVSFSFFFVLSAYQKKTLSDLEENIKENEEYINKLNLDIESLKYDYSMRNTDEFKEKIARSRLNMIKDDEYLYEDENRK